MKSYNMNHNISRSCVTSLVFDNAINYVLLMKNVMSFLLTFYKTCSPKKLGEGQSLCLKEDIFLFSLWSVKCKWDKGYAFYSIKIIVLNLFKWLNIIIRKRGRQKKHENWSRLLVVRLHRELIDQMVFNVFRIKFFIVWSINWLLAIIE